MMHYDALFFQGSDAVLTRSLLSKLFLAKQKKANMAGKAVINLGVNRRRVLGRQQRAVAH